MTKTGFNMMPSNFREAMDFSKMILHSAFCPSSFKKAEDVLIAIQMGSEIGLQPIQALQNIAVINGRPCVWGDASLAVVQNHPAYEYIQEHIDENGSAVCVVKRKGHDVHTVVFSIEDAKTAGLWGKSGPWKNYPKRMLQMRARGFALRDVFSDALKGLILAEEAQDYVIEKESTTKANFKSYNVIDENKDISPEPSVPLILPSPSEVLEAHGLTDPHSINTLEGLLDWVLLIKTLALTDGEKQVLRDMYAIRRQELEVNNDSEQK